jgi:hypothetical protein
MIAKLRVKHFLTQKKLEMKLFLFCEQKSKISPVVGSFANI